MWSGIKLDKEKTKNKEPNKNKKQKKQKQKSKCFFNCMLRLCLQSNHPISTHNTILKNMYILVFYDDMKC